MEFNENQKEAIDFYEGCCNVIASAGSGKTSVLVNRIAKLVDEHNVHPTRILAITFNKKAKENMTNRLKELLPDFYSHVRIETFHSFGLSIARKFSNSTYRIISADWEKINIIEEVYRGLYKTYDIGGEEIVECMNYISAQKNNLRAPQSGATNRNEMVYNAYEEYKKKKRLIDFDDMLTLACEILQNNPKALEYCQRQHQFILVDETQDTNAAQYQIIRLIAQGNPNLFFVGDMLQNIYEWRNSDNKYILDFDNAWKDFKPKTINLNCNYRSSQDIIEFANKFAKTIEESKHKHYVESYADKPKYKKPEYKRYNNEFLEAKNIASKINELIANEKYSYKDFAILARTNAQLANFESALSSASIPYFIVDGMSFSERTEIKIVLSYLKLFIDPSDDEAFEFVYNKPNRYLGKQFFDDVKKAALRENKPMYYVVGRVASSNWKYTRGGKEFIRVIKSLQNMKFPTVKQQIHYLRREIGLDAFIAGAISDDNNSKDKIDNLDMLCNIAADYTSTEAFIEYMSKLSSESDENGNSVKLMTIHKSKGLEFPVVFIPGVNEKILPHHRNDNIGEERRLMYVAITRAEKELYISSTSQYNRQETKPSIFISELFG